jgi:hypothetical protein
MLLCLFLAINSWKWAHNGFSTVMGSSWHRLRFRPTPVITRIRKSSVGIATVYGLDGPASIPAVQDFLVSTALRPALGPIQPPIQWVPVTLSAGVKWQGREANLLPLYSAEVKKGGAIPPSPPYVFMA